MGAAASLEVAAEATRAIPVGRLRVALVSMPFGSGMWPSIQLGTLAAVGRQHGFPTDTKHLNLDFKARLDPNLYEALCTSRCWPLGEWLFSSAAFGPDAPGSPGADRDLLDRELPELDRRLAVAGADRGTLRAVREEVVPAFLEDVLAGEGWHRYDVVGFSSVFQQNAASFALAAALKARHPAMVIVAGGANFEGEMGREWLRSIPAIDLAVDGEGEDAFPALLTALAEGGDPRRVPGVMGRRDGAVVARAPSPPTGDMDALPVPDYDEFFIRAEDLGMLSPAARRDVRIPFEAARGCWWGERAHCTFCGLNGGTMTYRSKSPRRVEAEIGAQTRRYRSFRFGAVDNILDSAYLDDLLPALADSPNTYELFWEVKSDLRPDRLRLLGAAGVRTVQPGIESLSSAVLRLMRKGVRAADNVNFLRWAGYHGLRVAWNLLWGFPGETLDHCRQQVSLIPHLLHLQPPGGASRITVQRFSPIFADREAFPATRLEPEPLLRSVFPDRIDLSMAAYSFDADLVGALADEAFDPLRRAAEGWKEAWAVADGEPPSLRYWHTPGRVDIEDRRRPGATVHHGLDGPSAELMLACSDRPVSLAELEAIELCTATAERSVRRRILADLVDQNLVLRDENLLLALAVPATGGAELPATERRPGW